MALALRGEATKRVGRLRPLGATKAVDWLRRAPSLLFGLVMAWRQCAAERRHLAGLNDRELKDLGLARSDVAPDSPPSLWPR